MVFRVLLFCVLSFLSITNVLSQDIEVYNSFDRFEQQLIDGDSAHVYVINFWATWCAPCVRELPFFEALHKKYSAEGITIALVSLDFKDDLEKRLKPFVHKQQLQSRVIHMADPDANSWISKIDKNWQGTIPVTLFLSEDKRLFIDQEFEQFEDLEKQFISFINQN